MKSYPPNPPKPRGAKAVSSSPQLIFRPILSSAVSIYLNLTQAIANQN